MRIDGTRYCTIWPDPENSRQVHIIDQRRLPHDLIIETLTTGEQAAAAIRGMHVRGAGLIGATAAFGMYLAALHAPDIGFTAHMQRYATTLDHSRPTARNLRWAIDRILTAMAAVSEISEKRQTAFKTACTIASEDASFCRSIGEHGLEILKKISQKKQGSRVNILTHCNAGWLAFVDYGSATAPIYAARDEGIPLHVWVSETRPWNQGTRLTAWELQQEGIDNTLICDSTAGHLMQNGAVDIVIVGSDRTTHTGDVANKIGTYLKALAAKDNNIPFYVALPSTTIDWNLDKGMEIPIEQRSGEEITTITGRNRHGQITTVSLAAKGTRAANYSFDITPANLITGFITERGIIQAKKEEIHRLFPEKKLGAEEGNDMTRQEQRKSDRRDLLYLLDYLVLDEEGNPGNYSMGRTIDVSPEGLKLETASPLAIKNRVRLTLGIKDDLIELEGLIIHTGQKHGRFVSGVSFVKTSENDKRVLADYIEAFHKHSPDQPVDKGALSP